MKKILNNKYVLFGMAFILGATLIWFVKPSDHQHIESSNNQISENTVFTCSMHPQIRQGEPGSCPICGMDLIPLEEDKSENIDPMAVTMSATAMQLANISTAIVVDGAALKTTRLNGKVQEDERLVYSQSTHFSGRIEELTVNFTGEYVRKGSPITYVYSPELVTAQEELFEAYKIRDRQPDLYRAAREKLKNWKLSESQLDQIIAAGVVTEKFPVMADQSGHVIRKMVNLGDYVQRGQALYEIANLSRVWVLFEVYERDLPWINKGDSIQFTINSIPGQIFKGTIDYLDPVIDQKTRVAKGRVVIQNKDQRLKPEMFASGTVKSGLAKSGGQLTVPKSAVMWTGKRSVVYVKLQSDQGVHFRMREVTLGPALGDAYIVEDGLEQGEEIAVNGTFSIDAAAQLAGKPSMMSPEGGAKMTGHQHGHMLPSENPSFEWDMEISPINPSSEVYDVSPRFRDQIRTIYVAYLSVKDALVDTDGTTAKNNTEKMLTVINNVNMSLVKGEAHMEWMKDLEVLKSASRAIVTNSDVEAMRMALSPLSDQLYYTLKKFNVESRAYRQFCPMAFDFQGAFWLSDSDEILNPYFGEEMLTCGNVEEELK